MANLLRGPLAILSLPGKGRFCFWAFFEGLSHRQLANQGNSARRKALDRRLLRRVSLVGQLILSWPEGQLGGKTISPDTHSPTPSSLPCRCSLVSRCSAAPLPLQFARGQLATARRTTLRGQPWL